MYDGTLAADLSALAGQTVTLDFTISSENDGEQLSIRIDTVKCFDPTIKIPEPTSLALLVSGGLTSFLLRRFSKRRVVPERRVVGG